MSSRETERWGWVMGTSSRFSTKREAIAIDEFGQYGMLVRRDFYFQSRRCCVFSDCFSDVVYMAKKALEDSEGKSWLYEILTIAICLV
jgi:hypothetical protein